MTIKDRIAAEKKAAQALIAKGEENLTDGEFEQLKGHHAELKKLTDRMELFEGAKSALDAVADGPAKPAQAKSARTMGEFVVNEVKGAGMSFAQAKAVGFETAEFKAATDVQMTTEQGTDKIGYAPYLEQVDTAVFAHRRPLTIVDLFGSAQLSGQVLKYPVFGKLEHEELMTAEGKAAKHSHFPAPTWVTDKVGKVSVMWDVTDEMMEDLPYVVSEINDQNDYTMSLEEEDQILSGDGSGDNINGLLGRIPSNSAIADDDARTVEDRIFHAKTMIYENTGFNAEALVISPADYEKLRLKKDANGQYYGGGFFLPAYGGTGQLVIEATPWGLKTVVTPAVEDGNCIVGAFRASGKVIYRGGRKYKATNADGTKFAQDVTTNKLTQRMGLQVKYPYGFVKVSTKDPVQSPVMAASAGPKAEAEAKSAAKASK
ncbi:MAG: phage major capsid protein [Collinsella sp.]|uniref:phage major capsid protein n=1 Tax=Collinsella sp. TaxID=1965294 RepID=UPI003990498E